MRITGVGSDVLEGILITGPEGGGKSFVGNMLCGDTNAPPPFEENCFSASVAPPYAVHEITNGKVVECAPNALAMKSASKVFSKACPVKTILFVWSGVLKADVISLFKTVIGTCPQPSDIILVHNQTEANAVASNYVISQVAAVLDSSPWHYVDCHYVAIPHNTKPSFSDAAVTLQTHVSN